MNCSPKSEETLESLSLRSRDGDEGAFVQLFAKVLPLIRNRACSYAQSSGMETEDLVQEGAIGLLSAVERYDEEVKKPFISFAAVCIENRIRSAIRHSKRSKRNIPRDFFSIVDVSEQLPDQSVEANPEYALEAHTQWAEMLMNVFLRLSPMEKKVFTAFYEDVSYKEIADRLGICPKAVDNSLQRIRKKLRKAMTEQ